MSYIKPLIILLLVLAVLQPPSTSAQEYRGLVAFSLPHPKFPCAAFQRRIFRIKRPGISTLFGTFGNNWSCLARTEHLIRRRPNLLLIHFSNETARRRRAMYQGEFLPELSPPQYEAALKGFPVLARDAVLSRSTAISKLVARVAGSKTEVMISTGLEDDLDQAAAGELSLLIGSFTGLQTIRSAAGIQAAGPCGTNALEIHAKKLTRAQNRPTNIVDPDGFTMHLSDYRALFHSATRTKAVFFMSPNLQGRPTAKFTPPRTRTFKFTMEDDYILSSLFY